MSHHEGHLGARSGAPGLNGGVHSRL
jgi:hypothetical protein